MKTGNAIRGTFNGYDVYDKNRLVKLSLKRRCLVLIKELRERRSEDAGNPS